MSFEELGTLIMGTLFFPMGFVIVCATAWVVSYILKD